MDKFLIKLSILDLLGLKDAPSEIKAEAKTRIESTIHERFISEVLPAVITEEEFDKLSQLFDQDKSQFDTYLSELIQKYPKINELLVQTTIQYKKLIIKNYIEQLKTAGDMDEDEYSGAQELYNTESWEDLYKLLVSKAPSTTDDNSESNENR